LTIGWLDPAVGTINVSASIPGASWTITGPQTHTGSGTTAQYTNTVVGNYTIIWNSVAGYTTPPTQSFILSTSTGGVILFSGAYNPIPPASVDIDFR
jgi:hypothetical protein